MRPCQGDPERYWLPEEVTLKIRARESPTTTIPRGYSDELLGLERTPDADKPATAVWTDPYLSPEFVLTPDERGATLRAAPRVRHRSHFAPASGEVGTIARQLVDQRQHPERSPIAGSGLNELVAPDVILLRWPQPDARAVVEPQPTAFGLPLLHLFKEKMHQAVGSRRVWRLMPIPDRPEFAYLFHVHRREEG
jgi:hypothetical protein